MSGQSAPGPAPHRKTSQPPMPARRPAAGPPGSYELYPTFPLPSGRIELGFEALAARLARESRATLDGFGGVLWEDFRARLERALERRGVRPAWVDAARALKPEPEIERLLEPFAGGEDPLFGTRFTGSLSDLFDAGALAALRPDPGAPLSIVYGCGAALAGWEGPLVYLDVPKNEVQFRARAGSITSLGARAPADPRAAYKRFYFVDWPALNAHKARLLPRVDVMVDAQRPEEPALVSGDDLRRGLERMSRNYFRARPWFEPGAWGGQRIKSLVPGLPQDTPNYAWSFELISPENGLVFESDGLLLEVSFDCIMFADPAAVLGDAARRFGSEFPIRFDFLDTVGGGNLSVQCHPSPEYARRHFGERFTQDETYYMLECEPDASVYLGFQEGVDPGRLRAELERSAATAEPVDVERLVQRHPARRHDLFLIPHGTVHCSGAGSLVLEISATPYIFTFKMYDWLRLDLDGKPRQLNIERALENLDFTRQGARVGSELISRPRTLEAGDGWRVVGLPTHPDHFYDIHRLEFDRELEVETAGACHVLSLVEGDWIELRTAEGMNRTFAYAETFVVPAGARRYRLANGGGGTARVVKAFVRPEAAGGAPRGRG